MHALGRVLLGTLYPQQYECMVKACRDRNEPLLEQEKWMFPENHAKTMARLLAIWNIPAEVYGPLNHILDPYCSLTRLSDPLRKQVETVKLAILLGQIAAERWEDWDLVECIPSKQIAAADESIPTVIDTDVIGVEDFRTGLGRHLYAPADTIRD